MWWRTSLSWAQLRVEHCRRRRGRDAKGLKQHFVSRETTAPLRSPWTGRSEVVGPDSQDHWTSPERAQGHAGRQAGTHARARARTHARTHARIRTMLTCHNIRIGADLNLPKAVRLQEKRKGTQGLGTHDVGLQCRWAVAVERCPWSEAGSRGHAGVRTNRHRAHQLTNKTGFWSLERWGALGELGGNGMKWGEGAEHRGEWGIIRSGWKM